MKFIFDNNQSHNSISHVLSIFINFSDRDLIIRIKTINAFIREEIALEGRLLNINRKRRSGQQLRYFFL